MEGPGRKKRGGYRTFEISIRYTRKENKENKENTENKKRRKSE
jgi:hypothetical protein